ncbi:MAG: hypothetical protein ACRC76_08295 [Proteocatella sp.]
MDLEKIISENKSKYDYVWVNCFDKLCLMDSNKINIDDLKNLIELKFFGDGKELCVKKVCNKEDFTDKEWCLDNVDIEEYIKEQQVISSNKMKDIKTILEKDTYKYVLELYHELAYEEDGQAYIKETHVADIKCKNIYKGEENKNATN